MKQYSSLCILLLLATLSYAQTFKYGKIPEEHWELKNCSFDSIADVLILFDVGDVLIKPKDYFDNKDPECKLQEKFFALTYERHIRFKVLTNNKLNSEFIRINLHTFNKKTDNLVLFKGVIQTKVNGKVNKRKIKYRDLNKMEDEAGTVIMTLEIDNKKVGSIIDIKYQIQRKVINEIPTWNFLNVYPNLYSEINYCIPDFIDIVKSYNKNNRVFYNTFNRGESCGVSYEISNGWKYKKYEYSDIIEQYSQKNLLDINKSREKNLMLYKVNCIKIFSVSLSYTRLFVRYPVFK